MNIQRGPRLPRCRSISRPVATSLLCSPSSTRTSNMLRSHLRQLAPALKRAHNLSAYSNASMLILNVI